MENGYASDLGEDRVLDGGDFFGGIAEMAGGLLSVQTAMMVDYSEKTYDSAPEVYQILDYASYQAVQNPEISIPLLGFAGIAALLDGGRRFKRARDNPYVPEDRE